MEILSKSELVYFRILILFSLLNLINIQFRQLLMDDKSSNLQLQTPAKKPPTDNTSTRAKETQKQTKTQKKEGYADYIRFIPIKSQNNESISMALQNFHYVFHSKQKFQRKQRTEQQIRQRKRKQYLLKKRKIIQDNKDRPPFNSPIKMNIKEDQNLQRFVRKLRDSTKRQYNLQSKYRESQKKRLLKKSSTETMIKLSKIKKQSQSTLTQEKSNKSNINKEYYLSDVIQNYQDRESEIRDHVYDSLYIIRYLEDYLNKFADYSILKKTKKQEKIVIVFDLDQTLIHCRPKITQSHQIQLEVQFQNNTIMTAPINVRPYTFELLKELKQDFELMVFTSSQENYANVIVDYLDPKKQIFSRTFSRQDCDYINQGYYIKDLRKIGIPLNRIVLIDNSPYSFIYQVDNGIPILPFFEGEDYQLLKLKEYLMKIKDQKDVRQINKQYFKMKEYVNYKTVDEMVQGLYIKTKLL